MDRNIPDTSDRISQLPDFIVHRILSFLDSYTDLIRTSVLSKRWFALWATFPNLDFSLSKMKQILEQIVYKRTGLFINDQPSALEKLIKYAAYALEKLIKYAAYTLSRFSEHNVSVHTLNIYVEVAKPNDAAFIDKWISFAVEKNVRVLNIHVSTPQGEDNYHLPETILSATSLTSLTLCQCELPSSLLVVGVKFKSLKSLCLKRLQIDEKIIKHLTTMCPLIEEFNFFGCTGYKVLSVSDLHNLQKVQIFHVGEVEMIDISAPYLTYLSISNTLVICPPHINMSSCKNLRTLCLGSFKLKTSWFYEFISSFTLLEDVHLGSCEMEKSFKISSPSLRKFEVCYCTNMKEIIIDASNLLIFRYVGGPDQTLFSLTSDSAKCEAVINFHHFHRLRRLLHKPNQFKVLRLYVRIRTDAINLDELKATCAPPPELEQLKLRILPLSTAFPAVIDAVFWCCRPQSLNLGFSVLYDSEAGKNFLKYVYGKLLHQNDQCQKEVEIVIVERHEPEKIFSNVDSLWDTIPGFRSKPMSRPKIILRVKSIGDQKVKKRGIKQQIKG